MNNLKCLHKIESRFYWSRVCTQTCPTLCELIVAWQALLSMEFSRLEILEWVAISFSIYWCTLKLIEFCTVLKKNTKFSMKRNTYFERKNTSDWKFKKVLQI